MSLLNSDTCAGWNPANETKLIMTMANLIAKTYRWSARKSRTELYEQLKRNNLNGKLIRSYNATI